MARISSVVMASMPQPKDTSWISWAFSFWVTYFAAPYMREWYVHWLSTCTSGASVSCQTASSDTMTRPNDAIS